MRKIILLEGAEAFISKEPQEAKRRLLAELAKIEIASVVSSEKLKKLTGTHDLWEIRVRYSKTHYRLIGFFDGNKFNAVVGFRKKTNNIPAKHLRVAEKEKRDHFETKRHNAKAVDRARG